MEEAVSHVIQLREINLSCKIIADFAGRIPLTALSGLESIAAPSQLELLESCIDLAGSLGGNVDGFPEIGLVFMELGEERLGLVLRGNQAVTIRPAPE